MFVQTAKKQLVKERVTKEQYDFYRTLYDQEERTSLQLEGRAKVYLGIVSAFLAAMILKASDAQATANSLHIAWGLMLLQALPMTIALALLLWALRIRNFEVVNDGAKIISDYGDDWPTQEQFYEDRLVDYAFASSTNRSLNNQTARFLSLSSWFMASGMVYLLGIVLFAIWRAQWRN